MTIALGFACKDGIVLGADSEITSGGISKWSDKKIIHFPDLATNPYFAFSGDVPFSKNNIQRLANAIESAEHSGSDIYTRLVAECRKIHKEYLRLYPNKDERPQLDLLLAIRNLKYGGLNLYGILGIEPVLVSRDEYIGFGEPIARAVGGPLYHESLTTEEAVHLAVYILMQTKEYAGYCGKYSHVVRIEGNWQDEPWRGFDDHWLSVEDTEQIQEDFKIFQSALLPVLASYHFDIYANTEVNDFNDKLKHFARLIKQQRAKRILNARRLKVKHEREAEEILKKFRADATGERKTLPTS